jgi:hypothetical protein
MKNGRRESLGLRHSFVVRIWQEMDRPEWKGWVQHVRTRESAFFHNPDELLQFIERQVGELTSTAQKGLK